MYIFFIKQIIQHHDFFLDDCLGEYLLLFPKLLKVSTIFISKARVKFLFHFELTGKMIDEYYAFVTTYSHVWPLKIFKEHI